MNVPNFQKELDKLLADEANYGKSLFLHSCCAPCSSYVLTYLSTFFRITVFYFNPNITEDTEYFRRVREQKRLIETLNAEASDEKRFPIGIVEGDYDPDAWFSAVRGLEAEPEGGRRCEVCFRLRLSKTRECAAAEGADYFATTLTISPLKNAGLINAIGIEEADGGENGPQWLPSDFKKKNGYQQSVGLSKKYGLYRQDYCGCVFSKRERHTAEDTEQCRL